MAESPLSRKMKVRPGYRLAVLGAPSGYERELKPLPADSELTTSLRGTFDWIQIFVKSKKELGSQAAKVVPALKPAGMLWVTFPKGTSGIQTDLTRDQGWDGLDRFNLQRITLISINDTWSAFAFRPRPAGKART
ncbi:MAG TPA: hypothetical protein VLD63_02225 [Anaerolineales bacterium]|nr:hypothetical protein [Anaerolineales bacterium]